MDIATEPLVVGVRFSKVGKVYHFNASSVADIKVGDMVVVETSRGWQLGQVAQFIQDAVQPPDGWKVIDRRATPRDLLLRQMWQMKEAEVVNNCRSRATELRLVGIKIISAEYSFDGSRLTILFSSESEEKYDLKSLRQDMQKIFAPSQVEMRQIGPRDVAKTVCGMGACGLETRCCCLFLTEFSSISIRMAKEQGISLTPTEITGMCGRLRCCLIYEYDTYVDARSKLPKRNKRVRTPLGDGKVVDVSPLSGGVRVEIPEVGQREFLSHEIQILDDNGVAIPLPPFQGTQQPSEIDQAIVGEAQEEPFTIKPDDEEPFAPPEKLPGERPGGPGQRPGTPGEQRPRGPRPERRPLGERGQGPDRPQGGRGPQRQDPKGQAGGRGPERQPGPERKQEQQGPQRPSGQPGVKGPRAEQRPGQAGSQPNKQRGPQRTRDQRGRDQRGGDQQRRRGKQTHDNTDDNADNEA
jgi:cell fate regulator YaaT (PSP1 superfamily)